MNEVEPQISLTDTLEYACMQEIMKLIPKTPLEIHRELLACGIFKKETQVLIAKRVNVNQGTVSRVAAGQFKRINKSVRAICKYAEINTVKALGVERLRVLAAARTGFSDSSKRKLADIIDLAVDLLERP